MPDCPDVAVYVERLARRLAGQRLVRIRPLTPFVVRTAVPPIGAADGKRVEGVERIGKRIVRPSRRAFVVMHLMIAAG